MVRRSIDNYEEHKRDVFNVLASKYGADKAKLFIDFYANRYDQCGRSYLDYRVAWSLFDDFKEVENSTGIRWYAFVGTGGTGKTTTAKNVLYFDDPTFNLDRVKTEADGIVDCLDSFPKVAALKGVLLDEPDATIHPNSEKGRLLRSILGKARLQGVFMAYCATDMRDIPNYIYKKISGIFFTPYAGRAFFFKDRPKKYVYVISELKKDYETMGYKAFFKHKLSKGCIDFCTTKQIPKTIEETSQYLKNKEEDYNNTIQAYKAAGQEPTNKKDTKDRDRLKKAIIYLRNEKKTLKEIELILGISDTQIANLLKEVSFSPPLAPTLI